MRHLFALLAVAGALSAVAACLSYSSPGGSTDAGTSSDASTSADATTSGDATSRAGDAGDAGVVTSSGTVTLSRDGGTAISPFAFGQNYWDWVDWSNDGVTGLTGTEPLTTALHLNVLRAGGDNNDNDAPQFFDTAQIDAFVAYCRAVGAEPILQVPLVANYMDGGASTPQTAADMVTYANVTKGYGITYWEIGNEPDIYPTEFDGGFAIKTAAEYCTQFEAYATAMKAANAAADGGAPMQLLGPELAYEYTPGTDWLTPFLDACKDSVDIVTVHRYPFSATTDSTAGALDDSANFQTMLTAVKAIVAGHARPNTPLGVTESNISYDYDPTKYSATSAEAAPGTFYAALWTADVMGTALQNGLWTLAFWNLGESDPKTSVLGYIEGMKPVPAYYAEEMISANFRGKVLTAANVPSGFSVYASYDASKGVTSVAVLNRTTTATGLTLAVDALAPQVVEFPALSITVVRIPDAPSAAANVIRYTADMAEAGAPPAAP